MVSSAWSYGTDPVHWAWESLSQSESGNELPSLGASSPWLRQSVAKANENSDPCIKSAPKMFFFKDLFVYYM